MKSFLALLLWQPPLLLVAHLYVFPVFPSCIAVMGPVLFMICQLFFASKCATDSAAVSLSELAALRVWLVPAGSLLVLPLAGSGAAVFLVGAVYYGDLAVTLLFDKSTATTLAAPAVQHEGPG